MALNQNDKFIQSNNHLEAISVWPRLQQGYFLPIKDKRVCLLSPGCVGGCWLSHIMKDKPFSHKMSQYRSFYLLSKRKQLLYFLI